MLHVMMMNDVIVLSQELQTKNGMMLWSSIQIWRKVSAAATNHFVHVVLSHTSKRHTRTPLAMPLLSTSTSCMKMHWGMVSSLECKQENNVQELFCCVNIIAFHGFILFMHQTLWITPGKLTRMQTITGQCLEKRQISWNPSLR